MKSLIQICRNHHRHVPCSPQGSGPTPDCWDPLSKCRSAGNSGRIGMWDARQHSQKERNTGKETGENLCHTASQVQVYGTMLSTKNQWQLELSIFSWWCLETSCDWQKCSLDHIGVLFLCHCQPVTFQFLEAVKHRFLGISIFCLSEAEIVLEDNTVSTHCVETLELLKCSAENFILHDGSMWVSNLGFGVSRLKCQYRATPKLSASSQVTTKASLFNSISNYLVFTHSHE